jgi:zeta-carotene desaturase
MPRVLVAGGGLAGLASAVALGQSGYDVDVLESRPFLGGRATSYPIEGELVDNCQHVLLRCCTNLLDFYQRLGVDAWIEFHREFFFLEPGGRVSRLDRSAGSFLKMPCLGWRDKLAVGYGLMAITQERTRRDDLDRITMLDWLREKQQPARAIERFWRQILVSAVNEDLDRMAASHGFQVFWRGFLASAEGYEMGVPGVPLGELYGVERWSRVPGVRLHLRTTVERILIEGSRARGLRAGGRDWEADHTICALPFERVPAIGPELALRFDDWEHSPITGIHLWFDRPVTDLPHGTLLDRTIQWFFNKGGGSYLQLVVSASRALLALPRAEVIALGVRELTEFLPEVAKAQLERAHVVKEARATFSARPGLGAERPGARTTIDGLYLAGDWTATGWPATMESAVRSGYMAAEAISGLRFLRPDLA